MMMMMTTKKIFWYLVPVPGTWLPGSLIGTARPVQQSKIDEERNNCSRNFFCPRYQSPRSSTKAYFVFNLKQALVYDEDIYFLVLLKWPAENSLSRFFGTAKRSTIQGQRLQEEMGALSTSS